MPYTQEELKYSALYQEITKTWHIHCNQKIYSIWFHDTLRMCTSHCNHQNVREE